MSFNNSNASHSQNTGYDNLDMIFNPGYSNRQNAPLVDKNYVIVTSLQEALSKNAPYNSKGLYLHQDGEYEFEIFTDANGRKTYEIFKRINCTNERNTTTISTSDYDELKSKVNKLEEVVYGKSANVASDGNAKMQ